jgi:hypothetical protein
MVMKTWIAEQWEWVKGFLSEKDGKASSQRLVAVMVSSVFAFNYNRIAWAKTDILDIPEGWAWLIAGIIGLTIVAKFVKNGAPNGEAGNGDNGKKDVVKVVEG